MDRLKGECKGEADWSQGSWTADRTHAAARKAFVDDLALQR